MNLRYRLPGILAILMLFAFPLEAQFSLSADFTAMYDDNINNNALQLEDRIGQLSLTAGYDWTSDNPSAQLFYSGSFSYFSRVLDRTFHDHTLGATYSSRLGGPDGPAVLSLGGTYMTRVNREYYSFYDHHQFSFHGNLQFSISEAWTGRAGYAIRSLTLSELPDLDYFEHYGFGQISTTLATRTTIIAEGDIGYKVYKTGNLDTVGTSPGPGGGNAVVTSSVPTVTQVVGLIRIGQAITDVTGLSVTALYQLNLQKETRYLSSVSGLISDDEVFDDRYAYEGPHGSVMLTQLIGENLLVRASAGLHVKRYSERPAFDLAGNEVSAQRNDTRRYATLLVQGYLESLNIMISAQYDYIVNSSNDEFFDYTNNALTLTASLPF